MALQAGGGFFGSGATATETNDASKRQAGQAADYGTVLNLDQGDHVAVAGDRNLSVTMTDHGAVQEAVRLAEGSTENALMFGAGAMELVSDDYGRLLEVTEGNQEDTFQFAAGTLELMRDSNQDATDAISGALTASIEHSDRARRDALEFSGGALERLLSGVEDTTKNTLSALADAQTDTIAEIGQQTKSEAVQSFDNLVKFAGVALLGIAGIVVMTR